MTNVQVRDVPENVLALLKRDAARHGRSLQGYLRDLLAAHAGVINNNEILDRAKARLAGQPSWGESDAAEIVRQGREERDRALGITE
ncbi:MAG TPA: hypothetical protein VGJ95_16870 [Pseudonocardiaceae bacterium]|jgi:plasmid stability protein